MPDSRKHRGQHPADARLFGEQEVPKLQQAVRDLCWLLSHGYAERSSLKLVGDRYRLQSRQRLAVKRSSCSRQAAARRSRHSLPAEALRDNELYIDGFNLLITVESALSGGYILKGADGCFRDMASIHGSYRRVMETEEAILLVGRALEKLAVQRVAWFFDRPVSNSGRLSQMVLEIAAANGWAWEASLYYNPDSLLKGQKQPIASSDSEVIDKAAQWFNLARFVVSQFAPQPFVLPLGKLARFPSY